MRLVTISMIAALCATAACNKAEEAPETEATDTASAADGQAAPQLAATATAETPQPEITDEDIPVAADFEEAADTEITDANYKAQLADLQKEIEADND
jgi:hypothetical protein